MSVKIYSNEGEVVYNLIDVDNNISSNELEDKYYEVLNKEEVVYINVYEDLVSEGDVVGSDNIDWCEKVIDISFDEYMSKLMDDIENIVECSVV